MKRGKSVVSAVLAAPEKNGSRFAGLTVRPLAAGRDRGGKAQGDRRLAGGRLAGQKVERTTLKMVAPQPCHRPGFDLRAVDQDDFGLRPDRLALRRPNTGALSAIFSAGALSIAWRNLSRPSARKMSFASVFTTPAPLPEISGRFRCRDRRAGPLARARRVRLLRRDGRRW